MKANKFFKNQNGSMDMVNTGIFLVVLLVVLYVGVNIIQSVSDASAIDQASYATGTFNLTANVTTDEVVNITAGGTVYCFEFNYTGTGLTDASCTNVPVTNAYNTSVLAGSNLTTAINAETTLTDLITATNAAAVTTITADATGTDANAYATVDNVTGGWAAALMSGGDTGDSLAAAQTSVDSTAEDSYAMANILPIVMIAIALLSGLIGLLYLFR